MAEDPKLESLNVNIDKDPNASTVQVQPIKSDKEVVSGVTPPAIGGVDLSGTSSERVENVVGNALDFKPTRTVDKVVLTIAAQLRKDVYIGATPYIQARSTINKQLESLLAKQGPHTGDPIERRETANAIILERTLNARFNDLSTVANSQLAISQDLLRFQTSTTSVYMKQGLALQYRQLEATNSLMTLTKAFAEVVENKLEAIKINTRLPDSEKQPGFFREMRHALVKEAKLYAVKKTVAVGAQYLESKVIPATARYLASDERPDLDIKGRVGSAADRVGAVIRKNRTGASVLDAITPVAQRAREKVSDLDQRYKLSDRVDLDQLWEKSSTARKIAAGLLERYGTQHKPVTPTSGSAIDPGIAKSLEAIHAQLVIMNGSRVTRPLGGEYAERPIKDTTPTQNASVDGAMSAKTMADLQAALKRGQTGVQTSTPDSTPIREQILSAVERV